jgi:hypothetical protein
MGRMQPIVLIRERSSRSGDRWDGASEGAVLWTQVARPAIRDLRGSRKISNRHRGGPPEAFVVAVDRPWRGCATPVDHPGSRDPAARMHTRSEPIGPGECRYAPPQVAESSGCSADQDRNLAAIACRVARSHRRIALDCDAGASQSRSHARL